MQMLVFAVVRAVFHQVRSKARKRNNIKKSLVTPFLENGRFFFRSILFCNPQRNFIFREHFRKKIFVKKNRQFIQRGKSFSNFFHSVSQQIFLSGFQGGLPNLVNNFSKVCDFFRAGQKYAQHFSNPLLIKSRRLLYTFLLKLKNVRDKIHPT